MAWDAEILLSPPNRKKDEPTDADEGDFRFYADATFRFANRSFREKQAIDVHCNGFHVFR